MRSSLVALLGTREESEMDVNEVNDQLAWALLMCGVAVVLLGGAHWVADANGQRAMRGLAILLGVVAAVLAIVRIVD